MHRNPPLPTEGVITDAPLRAFPLAVLHGVRARELEDFGVADNDVAPDLLAIARGDRGPAVVDAGGLPDPLPQGLGTVVLGVGDRRFVLLGVGTLPELPVRTEVRVPDPRCAAFLRAHHPSLVPVEGDVRATHRIVPLWPDPSLEVRGDVLPRDSWLPAPGQGIPVLVHAAGAPGSPSPDPRAAAVLRAERAVARGCPGGLLSTRAQPFGQGIRIQAVVVSADGRQAVRGEAQGPLADPERVAEKLVALLQARGAGLLESRIRGGNGRGDPPAA